MTAAPADKILEVLATIAETDEVRTNPDLALYDLQVLDSMKTVELIVALGQQLGVEISPLNSSARPGPPQQNSWPTSSIGSAYDRMVRIDRGPGEGVVCRSSAAHSVVLTTYYLAIIAALILLYGRGDFSTPAFVYQGF
jgi:D-alanine--poly(phosphoribitol) ligase subunit 2